ncbi:DUF6065 family protein [Tuwongella immobilis]|uniref:Uncharacterized protein n=1 Tax=Tuwongella immobilis TaxID=692036 RepID=A0A6C2YQ13_9BACT|nr:DUF6065 family protein [Tuwongella immobilis]VIP03437.1 Uncharacterized protein OS=Singulisphaera acidiphila (strain ATCC BAA-1392 / DSM 18658 / VKM B-2454 / MOB10) GN=Sinac_3320 PE=4 SV=1 [Tuwongella immobilis]VTS04246.1 Uncharacterized protein OS=Singulisphaera acidiphila (strain ATCC BAA-1392 / DSM 18658 / VKM B-2454 / MOB10) GN=Sinac_3320 PE=4 SV=1 [Tuwongella immobilis]
MSEQPPEPKNLPGILPDGEGVFTAYEIHDPWDMPLVTAPIDRTWMEEAHQRHPYRCLPLVMANQSGWMLLSPCTFRVFWYGGMLMTDLEVEFVNGVKDPRITSHFGNAVLTFSMPYLFRTPPGINLWVKGPSNWIKDGIQPLEGIVESDWSAATFTMNWKMTRPNTWITFEQGEPFCMLVPVPRGLAESFQTQSVPLAANTDLHEQYKRWEAGRSRFLEGLSKHEEAIVKQGWQKEYFQGKMGSGGRFDQHQTHLSLKPFTRKKPNAG